MCYKVSYNVTFLIWQLSYNLQQEWICRWQIWLGTRECLLYHYKISNHLFRIGRHRLRRMDSHQCEPIFPILIFWIRILLILCILKYINRHIYIANIYTVLLKLFCQSLSHSQMHIHTQLKIESTCSHFHIWNWRNPISELQIGTRIRRIFQPNIIKY